MAPARQEPTIARWCLTSAWLRGGSRSSLEAARGPSGLRHAPGTCSERPCRWPEAGPRSAGSADTSRDGVGSTYKGRECGLRDVLCLLGIEARTACRSEDLGEVDLDDGLDGGAITLPDLS